MARALLVCAELGDGGDTGVIVYHLSAADLGDEPVLRPRIPRDRMPFENRTVARVCAAPSVAGCLQALSGSYYNRGAWCIYAADIPSDLLVEPVAVPDAAETGELWLLEPTRFRRA